MAFFALKGTICCIVPQLDGLKVIFIYCIPEVAIGNTETNHVSNTVTFLFAMALFLHCAEECLILT